MLRVGKRLSSSFIFHETLKFQKNTCRYFSAISSIHIGQIMQSDAETNKSRITDILLRLDTALRVPGTANADGILKDFQTLDSLGATIPLTYCLDASNMLASRHDAMRTELLVQITSANYNKVKTDDLESDEMRSTRSQPNKDDPMNVLISHAINALFVNNNIDDALKLWVRMSNSGYLTSRTNLEAMLDTVIANPATAKPTLLFVDKLHFSMKANLWHQSPFYYTRILQVYRQVLNKNRLSASDVEEISTRLNTLWSEVTSLLGPLPVDLYATNVHCWVALNRKLTKLSYGNSQAKSERVTRYLDSAMTAYEAMLVQLGNLHSNLKDTKNENILRKLTDEMASILKEANKSELSALTATNRQAKSQDRTSLSSQNITKSTAQKQKFEETLLKYFPPAASDNAVGGTGTLDAGGLSVTRSPLSLPVEFQNSTMLMRLGISELPIELARQGKLSDALTVFENYLVTYNKQQNTAAADIAAEVATTTSEVERRNAIDYTTEPNSYSKHNNGGISVHGNQYFTSNIYASQFKTPIMTKTIRQSVNDIIDSLSVKSAIGHARVGVPSASSDGIGSHISLTPSTTLGGLSFSINNNNKENGEIRYKRPNSRFLSQKDSQFFEYVLCEIIRNASTYNAFSDISDVTQHRDEIKQRVLSTLFEVVSKAESMAIKYGIPLSPTFYASHVDALCANANVINSQALNSPVASSPTPVLTWPVVLKAALQTVDSLPDNIGRSSVMFHAIIRMLCSYKEPAPLFRAIAMIQEINASPSNHNANSKSSKKLKKSQYVNTILPETLVEILHCATHCLTDSDLCRLLHETEYLLNTPFLKINEVSSPYAYLMVLKARILATARLRDGHTALNMFRKYRALNGTLNGHTVDGNANDLNDLYHKVIMSLYLMDPQTEDEWQLCKSPAATSEFFLREMQRDGIQLTGDTLALLLSLFTKNAQIGAVQGHKVPAMEALHTFMNNCLEGKYINHHKVEMNEAILRELFKAYCVVGDQGKLFSLLNEIDNKYPNVTLTGVAFEPILYYFACILENKLATQSVQQIMETRNITPTPACIDPIVNGMCAAGRSDEALQFVIEQHGKHGVKPSPTGILRLLDSALKESNNKQAKQIVNVITKLYSNAERLQAHAPRVQTYLSDQHSELSATGIEGGTKDLENTSSWIDNDAGVENVVFQPANSMDIIVGEEKDEEGNTVGVKTKKTSAALQFQTREVITKRAPPVHLNVPLPRLRGSLTDEHLAGRFTAHGMELEK